MSAQSIELPESGEAVVEDPLGRYFSALAAWEQALLEAGPLSVLRVRPCKPLLSAVVFP
jgi:hypothetical protein